MIDSIEIVLLAFLIIMLMNMSIFMIIIRPYDITPLIVLISIVFILFPGILIYFESYPPGIIQFPITPTQEEIVYALSQITMYTCFLLLGSLTAVGITRYYSFCNSNITFKNSMEKDRKSNLGPRDWIVVATSLLCCGYFFNVIYTAKGLSLIQFFLPARYEMKTAYYFEVLYRLLPLAVAIVFTLRAHRFTLIANIFFMISLISAVSMAQRRDILVVLLAIFALKLLMNKTLSKPKKRLASLSKSRLKFFLKLSIGSLLLIALIPALWYTRSLATSIVRGNADFPMPWEKRGFIELLARSPGTGFETFLATRKMIDETEIKPLYSFVYPLYVWIPRSLWSEKPVNIEGLLVEYYGLTGHPSVFLPGDLYMNFGPYFLWFGSTLVGFFLSYISLVAYSKRNIFSQFLWVAAFSNLATLIKNGVCGFSGLFGFTMFLLIVIWFLLKVRIKPRKQSELREQL